MSTDEKKAYLQQYADLNREVQRQAEELMRMRSLAEKCTPVWSDTPKGCPEGGSLETSVERIVELEQELNNKINALISLRQEVVAAIESLPIGKLRDVLSYRYLCDMKWNKIAERMNYCERQIYNLYDEAIERIKIAVHCSINL